MNGRSLTPQQEKLKQLKELLPEAFTENKVDWEKLKATLGEDINFTNERYVLNWAGKSEAFKALQTPSTKTLIPAKDESINFDETENIFIEGENLEVLKVLQKSYFGKVKMIYIDPPYNTGNDSFIYPDSFSETIADYQKRVGDKDEEGYMTKQGMFHKNSKEGGQYHSNWLNMMYPRLFLAKNLMKEDGVIFVSINDNEVHNLRLLMNEIFGEENFLTQFVWDSEGNTDNQLEVKVKHEYVLCYLKDINQKDQSIGKVIDPNTSEDSNLRKGFADNNINKNSPANPPAIVELPVGFPCSEKSLKYCKKELDEEFFQITKSEKYISDTTKEKYDIEANSGLPVKLDDLLVEKNVLKKSCRIYGGFANANKLKLFIDNGFKPILDDDGTPISFYLNKNSAVRYRKKVDHPRNILSVLRNFGTTEKNKTELKKMGVHFSYPKPVGLLKYLIQIGGQPADSIILDFFSGSGTMGHAVLSLGKDENVKRKFICVQLPELCDENSEAFKAGYKTIADIAKERVRKADSLVKEGIESEIKHTKSEIKKLQGEIPTDETKAEITKLKSKIKQLSNQDLGFKVLKLSDSNFKQWKQIEGKDAKALEEQMKLFVDPVSKKSTTENMVYELLLKSGKDINSKLEDKKDYYTVNDNEMILLLSKVTKAIIEKVIKENPNKVIALDKLFKDNDQLKTNTSLQMKDAGIEFKTI